MDGRSKPISMKSIITLLNVMIVINRYANFYALLNMVKSKG